MNRLFATCCLLLASPSGATTLPRLQVGELFELSEVVVLVQIEEGQLLRTRKDYSCGAEYKARVLDSIKGHFEKNDIISFGPYYGESIGAKRVLFLARTSEKLSQYASSGSVELDEEETHYKKCKGLLPKYSVVFSGFGSVEVSFTTKFDYKEAVIIKNEWLVPPIGLEAKLREPGDNQVISKSGESWVRLEEFVRYLHSLDRAK